MSIRIQCPNPQCQQNVSVEESISRRKVRCRKCGTVYQATPTMDGVLSETAPRTMHGEFGLFSSLPTQFGRYHVEKLLGKGGMGAVYLAMDSQLNRKVALKIPFFNAKEEPKRAERFIREARAAASLNHPNICTVYDVGEVNGRPFITMAYIVGQPLEDLFDEDRLLPVDAAVEIIRKMALALQKAHDLSIVHRDLKPANVMITPEGEPVIMDFGLVKVIGEIDGGEARLTQEGAILGTPRYMAPEQVNGDQNAIGPATDIYALGVMLFELLTGRAPYSGALLTILSQIASGPVPDIRDLNAKADEELASACRKAMAKAPTKRFATMSELADSLARILLRMETSSGSSLSPAEDSSVTSEPKGGSTLSIASRSLRTEGQESRSQEKQKPTTRDDLRSSANVGMSDSASRSMSRPATPGIQHDSTVTADPQRRRRILWFAGGTGVLLCIVALVVLVILQPSPELAVTSEADTATTPVDASSVEEASAEPVPSQPASQFDPLLQQTPAVATPPERIELPGLWEVTAEQWGAGGPTEEWSKTVVRTLEFSEGRLKLVKTPPQGTPFGFDGTIQINEQTLPHEFDFVGTGTGSLNPVFFRGIIEVTGDVLRLAYTMGSSPETTPRLTKFEVQPGMVAQQFLTAKRRIDSTSLSGTAMEPAPAMEHSEPTIASTESDSPPVESSATPASPQARITSEAETAKPQPPAKTIPEPTSTIPTRYDWKQPSSWGASGAWSFDKGVISSNLQTMLWTKASYEDFDLDLEYLTTGDGGIFFHGLEVQLANGSGIYVGGTGAIYLVTRATQVPIKVDDWNRVSISVKGSRVIVKVNGQQTTSLDRDLWTTPGRNPDGTRNDKSVAVKELPRISRIGIQSHQGRSSYRNIRIRGRAIE